MSDLTASREERLNELLLRWEDLCDEGACPTPEQLCADDPDLVPELARRIAALRALDEGPLAGVTSRAGSNAAAAMIGGSAARRGPASCVARYDRLDFHAAGGLGEVFVARGDPLDRQVALKFIRRSRTQDPSSRRRFLREAVLTGRLEHPGVVPIYGLGSDADGQPCYAMRFIQGQTLEEAIQAFHRSERSPSDPGRILELRALLRRFLAVCNTVAYAHSRGIVHRDLKPRNILLGPFDETLVVDWGLARSFQDEPAEAGSPGPGPGGDSLPEPATAGLLGTPGYMSPEQADGRADRIGPPVDVYALGATLYVLLTGQAPFEGGHLGELLDKVRRGAFVPPRVRRPEVPRPLEAICLKAMATRPEERYASALDLAGDLDRWLADEPVSVWREPWHLRVRRFGRRHRTLVVSAAVLLVTAVVALVVGIAVLADEQHRTARARDEAQANFRTALAQRRRADANLEHARQAVDRFFIQVSQNRLLNEPGLQGLRRELLESARDYYQKITATQDQDQDPATRADLGRAHLRLAQLTAEIETPERALELVDRAASILEQLRRDHPEEPRLRPLRAECEFHRGRLHQRLGHLEEAEACLKRALDQSAALSRIDPDDLAVQSEPAEALSALGELYVHSGRLPEAEHAYSEARDRYEKLARDHPGEILFARSVTSTGFNLALVQRDSGRLAEAERGFVHAVERQEALARALPGDLDAQNQLVFGHGELALLLLRDLGRPGEAEPHFRRAAEVARRLASENPLVTSYQQQLAQILNNLGILDQQGGRLAEALACHEEALGVRRRLVGTHPDVPSYRAELAASLGNLALLDHGRGEGARAESALREAQAIFETLAHDAPDVLDYSVQLGTSLYFSGVFQSQRFAWADAADSFDRARAALDRVLGRVPGHPAARSTLVFVLWGRSQCLSMLSRHDDALRELGRAAVLDDGRTREALRLARALILARRGDAAAAQSEAGRIDPAPLTDGSIFQPGGYDFDRACLDALLSAAAARDAALEPAERARIVADHAARAMEHLEAARRAGFFEAENTPKPDRLQHPDLDPLRSRPDFQAFVKSLPGRGAAKPDEKP